MVYWYNLPIWDGNFADYTEIEDIYNSLMCITCVICAGLAAGLTMGLLSLDITKLEIKAMIGDECDKRAAIKVIPIVKQHHLLLVTLLLFNSLANEALPVFLGSLVPNYLAILLSVSLILVFGEILPSAFFTGPKQLQTAAMMSPFVVFLMSVLSPIAFPISKLLDKAFGENESTSNMSRDELEALLILQNERAVDENHFISPVTMAPKHNAIVDGSSHLTTSHHDDSSHPQSTYSSSLTLYEVKMVTGTLRMSKVKVFDIMIPASKTYMLSSSIRLSKDVLQNILNSGYSRIPVYEQEDITLILGYLLVKTLIVVNPSDAVSIASGIPLKEPIFVRPNMCLLDLLNVFRISRCHLALVSDNPVLSLDGMRKRVHTNTHILGMVTLEDVIENMIQEDIIDETDNTDLYNDVSLGAKTAIQVVRARTASIPHTSGKFSYTPTMRCDSVELTRINDSSSNRYGSV